MTRLTVVSSGTRPNSNLATNGHRASVSEGEALRRLLDGQGFVVKRVGSSNANAQYASKCPFHEGPGSLERKGPTFYFDIETSVYVCHSASCGERGNLRTMERYFGIDVEDGYVAAVTGRETQLKEYERNLIQDLRTPFYEHGLTDETIERFRLGYEPEHLDESGRTIPGRYVIPYLESRRPKFFRYYNPTGDPKWKYTWESGAESTLYNPQDAMGDSEGRVFICEGEQKAMLLVQMGYAAVAVPGASQWKPEWQGMFTHARQVFVAFDNDNPAFHIYDKVDEGRRCQKCQSQGLPECRGHNPGQEAAARRVDQIGWRAKNVVLPLPGPEARKVDINDYFMRDGHSNADFIELVTGKRGGSYRVDSLADIMLKPPEASPMLVEHGILPKGGRLLIAGRPKAGKSIFVNNLCLSLAAGIPFLKHGMTSEGFEVDHPTRTLLLDRELSKAGLFKRFGMLIDGRPGYRAALENLLIDHDHLIRLDQKGAYDVLCSLVEQNGAEVVVLDTAYKFLGGDIESSSALSKAFEVLDKLIHETGVSVVMTHHKRKGAQARGKENTDSNSDPESVAGSFLWTGWPNATILLNFLNRSTQDPFNTVASFAAFRDAAPPEPLALYRGRDTIAYTGIAPYTPDSEEDAAVTTGVRMTERKLTTENMANLLLEMAPCTEDHFLHQAATVFRVGIPTLKPHLIDVMATGFFERSKDHPPKLQFVSSPEEEQTWEEEHHLPPKKGPEDDTDVFDIAALGQPIEVEDLG